VKDIYVELFQMKMYFKFLKEIYTNHQFWWR